MFGLRRIVLGKKEMTEVNEQEKKTAGGKSELELRKELRNMLTNSEFSIKGECAISLLMTKLHIINTVLFMELDRNVIQMKAG